MARFRRNLSDEPRRFSVVSAQRPTGVVMEMMARPEIQLMDVVGPALAAAAFRLIMSLVREPARPHFHALFLAAAAAAYLHRGLALRELAGLSVAPALPYLSLRSSPFA